MQKRRSALEGSMCKTHAQFEDPCRPFSPVFSAAAAGFDERLDACRLIYCVCPRLPCNTLCSCVRRQSC